MLHQKQQQLNMMKTKSNQIQYNAPPTLFSQPISQANYNQTISEVNSRSRGNSKQRKSHIQPHEQSTFQNLLIEKPQLTDLHNPFVQR